MKKDKRVLITVLASLFLILGGLAVYAGASGMLGRSGTGAEEDRIDARELELANYFERYADDAQKEALANSIKYDFLGPKMWYERQISIILGRIPEDSPRITLEQARKICSEIDLSGEKNVGEMNAKLRREFNKYAVPDYDGGSGIRSTYYFFDDEPTGYIVIRFDRVTYYDLVNGTTEELI